MASSSSSSATIGKNDDDDAPASYAMDADAQQPCGAMTDADAQQPCGAIASPMYVDDHSAGPSSACDAGARPGGLYAFLAANRTNDRRCTHVSLGRPKGKYYVGLSTMSEFWRLYASASARGAPLYLAERPDKEVPILVDVDLKARKDLARVADDGSLHLYDDAQLETVVRAYQDTLRTILAPDTPDDALTCVVLEKAAIEVVAAAADDGPVQAAASSSLTVATGTKRPAQPIRCDPSDRPSGLSGEADRAGCRPTKVSQPSAVQPIIVKNGFHLHFPKLFVDKRVVEAYVLPLVRKRLAGLFDAIGASKFIDEKAVSVSWLLYGSRKCDGKPYAATRCYAARCAPTTLEAALDDYVIDEPDGTTTRCRGRVRDLLARILSIQARARYLRKTKETNDTPLIDVFAAKKDKRRAYDQLTIASNLADAMRYVDVLDASRADDYGDWFAVGACLWNISKGDDEGMVAWMQFSERSPKYGETECMAMWNSMRASGFTIGTLKYYAKQDNPQAYEAITKEKTERLLPATYVRGTHNQLAEVLYNEYGNEFVYSQGAWYQFSGHIWHQRADASDLRERISKQNGAIMTLLRARLRALGGGVAPVAPASWSDDEDGDSGMSGASSPPSSKRARTKKRGAAATRGGGDDPDKKAIEALQALIDRCENANFKNLVIRECQEVFRNYDFTALLNKDCYCIAFTNGVYDFANDAFRDGKPEDYISVAVSVDYEEMSPKDDRVLELEEFFEKVFPDAEIRAYFLDHCAKLFIGGNAEKLLHFWTGGGDNAKTVTRMLLSGLFGRLAITFSTTLLTGKKTQTGAATPELARGGNGVRLAVMDEPNNDEQLSVGLLKQLTGNDPYMARELYQKGCDMKDITPMFKLVMICNTLPGIKYSDEATWNRIRVIPFESKFVSAADCPESYEEQFALKRFPVDDTLMERLGELTQPLAWFLIDRWRVRLRDRKTRIIAPRKVRSATQQYEKENNMFKQFISDTLTYGADLKTTATAMYSAFQEWYREESPHHAMPNRRELVARLSTLIGDAVEGARWDGVGLRARERTRGGDNVVNPML
jgi:P4 family phage/plasmid primase-like protien